ncbi:MAG: hypothetical protein IJI04_06225 [Lachnospiraceae bacterium]|nr:hypothetical protein [Lachnospiraceae bacterium]
MDNSSDFEKYLSNDDALRELAKADAIGIANYYGLIEKSSGDKHTLDSSWRELYSFIRFDELYNRHFCDYASSIFGSKATWRPPISMNWTFAKPDLNTLGDVSAEELSSAGDYQDIIDFTFFMRVMLNLSELWGFCSVSRKAHLKNSVTISQRVIKLS